jgi:hypothetical protein
MARLGKLVEAIREENEITRRAYGEQLELTRTVIVRNGEAFDRMTQAFEDLIHEFREMVREFREVRAETRAQTEAIFRLIDRLGPEHPHGEPGPA